MLEGGINLHFEDQLVGEVSVSDGTLGCFAWLQNVNPARAVMLSNDHVLYGAGAVHRNNGDPVIEESACGLCKKTLARLSATKGRNNDLVDAAIAEMEPGVNWMPRVNGISIKGTVDLRKATLDLLPQGDPLRRAVEDGKLIVKKYGAVTGLTLGYILFHDKPVTDQDTNFERHHQMVISPVRKDYFSHKGDSGSVIYVDNSPDNNATVVQQIFGLPPVKSPDRAKVVALLWGGGNSISDGVSGGKELSTGSHIEDVTSLLQIKIATNAPQVIYEVGGEPRPHPALRRIYQDIQPSQRAKALAVLAGKHTEEIQELLRSSRRFIVAWQRNHGPQMVRSLMAVAENRQPFLPADFEGQSWTECVLNVAQALREVGSPALRRDLLPYLPLAAEFGGRSYAEVLGFLALMEPVPGEGI